MKVAAYQAPLLAVGSMDSLLLIRQQVKWCESEGIEILCCPEAILGGLADYATQPNEFTIRTRELDSALSLISSDTVTTIIGFSELAETGALFNSAAVLHRGSILGVYRKLHPAINRSIYHVGGDLPVFKIGDLTCGIVICNDSNYPELAKRLAFQGATVLFIPTNSGLPANRAYAGLVDEARSVDIATAVQNKMWVIRADVAGHTDELVSSGSSGIVDPDGKIVQSARELTKDILVAEIATSRV